MTSYMIPPTSSEGSLVTRLKLSHHASERGEVNYTTRQELRKHSL